MTESFLLLLKSFCFRTGTFFLLAIQWLKPITLLLPRPQYRVQWVIVKGHSLLIPSSFSYSGWRWMMGGWMCIVEWRDRDVPQSTHPMLERTLLLNLEVLANQRKFQLGEERWRQQRTKESNLTWTICLFASLVASLLGSNQPVLARSSAWLLPHVRGHDF